mmetsp:Transcript_28841/g.68017  ORF Transcript_28841/g.68017 Transcript_28841/m.68017 type:complete len:204 (-) Transcript_28841:217-828(-)
MPPVLVRKAARPACTPALSACRLLEPATATRCSSGASSAVGAAEVECSTRSVSSGCARARETGPAALPASAAIVTCCSSEAAGSAGSGGGRSSRCLAPRPVAMLCGSASLSTAAATGAAASCKRGGGSMCGSAMFSAVAGQLGRAPSSTGGSEMAAKGSLSRGIPAPRRCLTSAIMSSDISTGALPARVTAQMRHDAFSSRRQ